MASLEYENRAVINLKIAQAEESLANAIHYLSCAKDALGKNCKGASFQAYADVLAQLSANASRIKSQMSSLYT